MPVPVCVCSAAPLPLLPLLPALFAPSAARLLMGTKCAAPPASTAALAKWLPASLLLLLPPPPLPPGLLPMPLALQ